MYGVQIKTNRQAPPNNGDTTWEAENQKYSH